MSARFLGKLEGAECSLTLPCDLVEEQVQTAVQVLAKHNKDAGSARIRESTVARSKATRPAQ